MTFAGRRLVRCMNAMLSLVALERRWVASRSPEMRHAPIFILSPPRSGSTFLYQLLVHCQHAAYTPRILDFAERAPVLACRLARWILPAYESDFSSEYGVGQGLLSPSECNKLWARWFPTFESHRCHYAPYDYLSASAIHEIQRIVASLEHIFGAPFISKCINHSVRVGSLSRVFPNAIYIRVIRSFKETSSSLLRARVVKRGDVSRWWSVIPPGLPIDDNLPVIEQICRQILMTHRAITSDLQTFASGRVVNVHYDNLRRRPEAELTRVVDELLFCL